MKKKQICFFSKHVGIVSAFLVYGICAGRKTDGSYPNRTSCTNIPFRGMGWWSTPPDYYRDRPPFLAPAGTKNVAFGKSVSSSAPPVHGELKQITDGDKKYCEHASVVEIPKGVQWVQIDLEYEYQIYAVLFWHFRDNFVYYWDIVVQISNSQDFKEGVADVYNNDLDNTLGFGVGKDATYEEDYKGRLVDAKGVSGRYVRLYSNGNINDGFNHYVEVQVYGLPTDNSKL